MQPLRTLLLLSCLILAGQPLAAAAQPTGSGAVIAAPEADDRWAVQQDLQVAQGGGVSLEQAIAQVRRKYPGGRIISAETRRNGNREVHHIKVLTQDGKVKTEKRQGRRLNSRG